nr:MAG: DNA-binding protein [Bacteriophage sp.]
MIKTDIVDYIVNNTTLSRSQAINATDSVIEAISHSLINGESVFIRGFATIKAIVTAPKKARNINKGTAVTIPAQHSAKLVLSKDLKERMNKK